MAPVFSKKAWRCVWHMIQNDLVHGWGLDFALRRCVDPAHQKVGVVDAQWIIQQVVPSLGSQGKSEDGKAPWEGASGIPVSELCQHRFLLHDNDATQHIFEVSAGLDSLFEVVGFGRNIIGLFKHAITVGKRVRTEENIAAGAVSVSSAAVELALMKIPPSSHATAQIVNAFRN